MCNFPQPRAADGQNALAQSAGAVAQDVPAIPATSITSEPAAGPGTAAALAGGTGNSNGPAGGPRTDGATQGSDDLGERARVVLRTAPLPQLRSGGQRPLLELDSSSARTLLQVVKGIFSKDGSDEFLHEIRGHLEKLGVSSAQVALAMIAADALGAPLDKVIGTGEPGPYGKLCSVGKSLE